MPNYVLTHDFAMRHGKRLPRVIATWQSLGDYFEDVQTSYSGLKHKHDAPAIKQLLLPDPKITDKLERFRTAIDTTEFVKSTRIIADTSGDSIDIGKYLSGEPECFDRYEKFHGTDIRIVFSPEVHVTSNSDALYLRGAAVMSLMDTLESQGNRVELWMGWDNTVNGKVYESRILVKRANDYTTAQQLAGVACDSRFLDTCEFNMISHFLQTSDVGYNAGISMEGDIVLSGNYKDMKHFDSIASCEKWVEGMKEKLSQGEKKIQ